VLALALAAAPALGLLPAGPATAQDLPAAQQQAIVDVISGQLDAFQRDAWQEAWSYASPGIQSMFRTPDNFRDMVTSGYRPVYRPQSVDFLDIVMERGQPTQRVLLVDGEGRRVVAHYYMEQQPDGTWKIAGVTLHEGEDLNV
jgi:hypothetical protein